MIVCAKRVTPVRSCRPDLDMFRLSRAAKVRVRRALLSLHLPRCMSLVLCALVFLDTVAANRWLHLMRMLSFVRHCDGIVKVALYAAEKLLELGAIPVTFSDSSGHVYEPEARDEIRCC